MIKTYEGCIVMAKEEKCYRCIVSDSNQSLEKEYVITVSNDSTNDVIDKSKLSDEINISNVSDTQSEVVDNGVAKNCWFAKINNKLYYFAVAIYYLAILINFFVMACILYTTIKLPNSKELPKLNKNLTIVLLSVILVILAYAFIYGFNFFKHKNAKFIPEWNNSYTSLVFYVVILSVIVGCLFPCIKAYLSNFTDSYAIAVSAVKYISNISYIFSLCWIMFNVYKATKNKDTEKYMLQLNQVIQFCISVLTVVGVFIGPLYESYSEIFCWYVKLLIIYLFIPYLIPSILKYLKK